MWPTATATDAEGNGMRSGDRSTEPKLAGAARMWGTPTAHERTHTPRQVHHGEQLANPNSHGLGVASLGVTAARHGPHDPTTPTAGNDGSPKADLNPRFVAALMGVPWDWLNPSTSVETDSFHEWQQKHSPNWRLDLPATPTP